MVAAAFWHLAVNAPEPASTLPSASNVDVEPALGTPHQSGDLRRDPGTCAVVFPSGDAHLSGESIALAALDTFDIAAKRTRTESAPAPGGADADAGAGAGADAESAFTVASCRGTRVKAWPRSDLARGNVSVLSGLVAGAPELAEEAGLGSSVVARIVVGETPGQCPRAIGFLVLATLRARRLEIDALAEWEGPCGPVEPVSVIGFAGDVALLEEDGDTSEGSPHTEWNRVWLRRANALVNVGNVRTRLEDEHEPWVVPGIQRSMTAELAASPRGLIARETWTHEPVDGGPSKTTVIERAYVLDGLKLR